MSSTLTTPLPPPQLQRARPSSAFVLLACTGVLIAAGAGFVLGRTSRTTTSPSATVAAVGTPTKAAATGAATTVAGAPTALDQALALHSAGQLDEAAKAYAQILVKEPTNKYALFNLGQIAQTRKESGGKA